MSSARPLFFHGSGSKGMQLRLRMVVCLGLPLSRSCKFLSLEEGAEAEVALDIQDLWVVPKRATRDTDIEDVYGVDLEDEDENSEDEDLDWAGEGAGSSSSYLRTHMAPSPPVTQAESSNSSRYDVDEAVLRTMKRGSLHEWTVVEFRAICRNHDLYVRGGKSELMEPSRFTFKGCTDSR